MSATVQKVAQHVSLATSSATKADGVSSQGQRLVSQNMDGIN